MIKDLFFGIFASDKTGDAFGAVGKKLRGLEGAAATAADRIGRVGTRLAGFGALATAATAPLFLAFADSLSAYDASARAEAKVAQAIKSTGGAAGFTAEKLGEVAAGLQAVTRFDGDDILADVTGQLLTFTNITGNEFIRAQKSALDLSTVLENDVQSSAIMLGKALNDPVKGLSALSKAGVQFSEDQKSVIKALVETGDTAAAQQVILAEIEKQYGGQAEASAQTGLGSLARLSNAWGDVKEVVGGVIAEILPPVVDFIQKMVNGFLSLPEPVQRFIVVGGALALVLGPVAAAVGLVVAGIAALGAPVALAIAGVVAFSAALVALWPLITAGVDYLAGLYTAAADYLGEKWTQVVTVATDYLGRFAQAHVDAAAIAIPVVIETYNAVADYLGEKWNQVWTFAADAVARMVAAVTEYLTTRLSAAFDYVKGAVAGVKQSFFDLYDSVVGNSYVPDMVDGISAHFSRLGPEMVMPAEDATGTVEGAFSGLARDSIDALKGMARDGKITFKGFADALISSANRMADSIIDDAFSRLGDAAADSLGSLFSGGGRNSSSKSGNALSRGIGSALGGIGDFLGGALGDLVPGFATGADFTVGGRGGTDRNLVAFRANATERVTVSRPGDAMGGAPINVYISTPSPAAFAQSQGQVSAQIARAVARGQRNL